MPTANDAIVDKTIAHQIRVERVKDQHVREAIRYLETEVLPDITIRTEAAIDAVRRRGNRVDVNKLKGLNRNLAMITQTLAAGIQETKKNVVVPNAGEIGLVEAQSIVRIMESSVEGITVGFNRISPSSVAKIIRTKPYEGAVLNQWWKKLSVDSQADLVRNVKQGIIQGQTNKEIINRVTGTQSSSGVYGRMKNSVDTQVRTLTNNTVTQVREQTYEENRSRIKGVEWLATLDGRTSLICAGLDGQIFPINSGPRPPAHFNCRSTTVPVLKGFSEFGLKNPPASTRASLDGQVSADVKYPEWLKGQPKDIQLQVLGPTRRKLWLDGEIKIEKFTSKDLRPISVADLKKMEGIK